MKIEQVCTDVLRLSLMPPDVLNVYVIGDTLVDAGGKFAAKRLIRALSAISIGSHALTHAHLDHQGCSHTICDFFDIPLMCGEGDRRSMETCDQSLLTPDTDKWYVPLLNKLAGPAHPVSRVLREGDEVGGFTVIETPGHTPGSLSFWRASDGVLVLGDVLFHRNPATFKHGLAEPFAFATFDPEMNRQSARKLAALKPSLVCFGHGEPLREGEQFVDFVSTLPIG
jgi:glyoxylase-like metal-dependent hydrolase (beta-lactamase superfamily II)